MVIYSCSSTIKLAESWNPSFAVTGLTCVSSMSSGCCLHKEVLCGTTCSRLRSEIAKNSVAAASKWDKRVLCQLLWNETITFDEMTVCALLTRERGQRSDLVVRHFLTLSITIAIRFHLIPYFSFSRFSPARHAVRQPQHISLTRPLTVDSAVSFFVDFFGLSVFTREGEWS